MPGQPGPKAAEGLAQRVAAGLGASAAGFLATTLSACVGDPARYEASVHVGADGVARAGRVMIEGACPDVVNAIAHALDVVLPPHTTPWLDIAKGEGVPIIAGWDLRHGGRARCVKLYVNASDVSRSARARLCAALTPGLASDFGPPAVVGMNVWADGVTETKLYIQSADALALANAVGKRPRALAAAAFDEGADAGGVLSLDAVDGALRPRAFFVALREPPDELGWQCVRTLPSHDPYLIESLLPFAAAPPRSVGISLKDEAWTLYCKPRHSGRAPETLEPAAIFRVGDTEVGVFVEPIEHATRAFDRTARHAVIVRVRAGAPLPPAIESLIDWFTARLRAAERSGVSFAGYLTGPPPPWHIVGTPSAPGDQGDQE